MCQTRSEDGDVQGVDWRDLANFYSQGRAQSTMETYNRSFRKIWEHSRIVKQSIFSWKEGQVSGLIIALEKKGSSENDIKQCMAVINMIFEIMGRDSPSKSSIVKQVKNTFVKKFNKSKKQFTLKRRGTTLKDIEILIKNLYKKPAGKVQPQRRRFLLMQLCTFFGMKRFSDISNLRVSDIEYREDRSLKIRIRKSKTDQLLRGSSFTPRTALFNGHNTTDVCRGRSTSIYTNCE